MKCPSCNFVQSDRHARCLKCGLRFDGTVERKWVVSGRKSSWSGFFRDLLFSVEAAVNLFHFAGRVVVFVILVVWGWVFILTPISSNGCGGSFLHLVNLPFHEAGHVIFQLFGRWMMSLGGTLGQLLIPLVCLSAFLLKSRNTFGAAACLWWLGQNFMDIAPYINDAREGELMLLGGITGSEADYGFHDWEFILNEIGLLRYDHFFARLAHGIGVVLMLVSFVWAGYLLYGQYKNVDRT